MFPRTMQENDKDIPQSCILFAKSKGREIINNDLIRIAADLGL